MQKSIGGFIMANEKNTQQELFEFEEKKTIKGYPELRWTGKRPYKSTQYYPAQLKEVYGNPDKNGWINKIFWGDNLQVMSHLLEEFRGKIDLVYIDPPFDSKADYKLKVKIKGAGELRTDSSIFEEKQYGDIWTNDEYLQFMYERLILLRELLADSGSIFVHLDWHKVHHIRLILDEVFGESNFVNEIIWGYKSGGSGVRGFSKKHDNILMYSKNANSFKFNVLKEKSYMGLDYSTGNQNVKLYDDGDGLGPYTLVNIKDWWTDIGMLATSSKNRTGYPTQKPDDLIERIIKATTDPDDLVLDCFMGSGTTQAVAMKLGRRFLGADINLTSIQTTSKRLNNILKENDLLSTEKPGFEVYNVNNYDFFRNPLEAKELLIEALGIQQFSQRKVFDGELDGRNVKIMPINRIATKADLKELIANLPYTVYDKKKEDAPNSPVDNITLVCMGHEPDLTAAFKQEVSAYKIDVEIVDILTDKKDFEFKREAQAEIKLLNKELVIESFYPMNLMQKLSLQKESVENYKQLVESIMIDWNYDEQKLRPTIVDIPEKNEFVKGLYSVPSNHGKIRVKITDLLSESLEIEVN